MRVFDIFRSIQGEGTRAGLVMDFVRLAGCDLACSYCDTPEARDPSAGRDMTVAEVLTALPSPPVRFVEITGGEPMLQPTEVSALVARLIAGGREVLVETSGAHLVRGLKADAVRILDVKTPGSGMADRMCWANLDHLTHRDEVKFVLTDRADYDWAKQVVARYRLADRAVVLFSPAAPSLPAAALARWMIDDALPVRLNLQIHKYLRLP
jgi:7-carboxy-7-deazaguanine synthase